MPTLRNGPKRCSAVIACAGAAALSAGGCQQYEPRALDLAGHREAFLARTPESAEVRAFVARLEPGGGTDAAGFDPSDGVSAGEAEVIALVFNAELRVERLRAGVTRASAEHAGLWEDPSIGVDLTRIIQSTPDPWKVFANIGLTVPISGRLEVEKRLAGVEHGAALARLAQSEWRTRMDVRRAWTESSALSAQVSTTREFVSRVEQVLAIVDVMERAGEMARTEARLFRIERAGALAELSRLEYRLKESALVLRRLMGLSAGAPVEFRFDGIGAGAMASTLGAADVGLEFCNPAVLVAAAEYEAAERALELEVRKQYPDLHIGPGYGREDGQDQVLLGLSLPLPILNGNRRGIEEARAAREVARANADAALEQALSSVALARARIEAAERAWSTLETEIVPLVDAQYGDARNLTRLGEVKTLVLLESLTRQQEAKRQLIEAGKERALANVALVELFGPARGPAAREAGSTDDGNTNTNGSNP